MDYDGFFIIYGYNTFGTQFPWQWGKYGKIMWLDITIYNKFRIILGILQLPTVVKCQQPIGTIIVVQGIFGCQHLNKCPWNYIWIVYGYMDKWIYG